MSTKRLLTEYEIQNILSIIKPQHGIPIDTAISVSKANQQSLKEQLIGQLIYPEMIQKLQQSIEEQYFSSLIQPGESVGVIGAQSIGEKQTQTTLNSIDYTDKILYIVNDEAFVEPIGQMIDNLLYKNKEYIQSYQKNKTEYLALTNGNYFIPSGDKYGFNHWLKIEAVTRHLPEGKLVKVITQSGRTVIASQCKSFLVWNGDKFISTLGSDVKIGDILPVTKNMPRFSNESIKYFDMSTIFPKDKYLYSNEVVKARECREKRPVDWFTEYNGKEFVTPYNNGDTLFGKSKDFYMLMKPGYVYIHTSNSFASNIPDNIPLDYNFGFLIGIYLAEGWCTKKIVGIHINDENIKKRVTDFCYLYGVSVTSDCVSKELKIHSTLFARMLKIICDTGYVNKFIPCFAYTAPKEFITGLVDGYFSGCGTVNKKNGSIIVSSISEQLIHGVSFLLSYLLIFGRFSSYQQKKNGVEINRVYVLNISSGFAQQFAKEIRLTELNKQKNLEEIINKKYMYDCGRSQRYYPSERDVYFDAIVSIEYVKATNGLVYDFTVEKTRNFMLFNGLNVRDTFHKAGSGEKTVTTGVPRVEELLNATKDQRVTNCIVFMKDKHETIQQVRDTIGHSVVALTFAKISKSYEIVKNKEPELWYDSFKIMYGDNFTKYTDCISLELNMDILFEYKLNMEMIRDILVEEYSDMECVFSPDNIGKMDIYVDTSNIDLPENRLVFIDSENASEIYLEEVVQPLLYNIVICGIPGIEAVYFKEDVDSFETDGSNFQKILGLPFINPNNTLSNNVWDIYDTLGVEAVRQFLIEEFMGIMEGINKCHIQLLAEKMTHGGAISSISRYTMRTEESGPFSKASFEETMDNFLKAGIYGQEEETKGVSSSIICGKRSQIGTGFCEIRMDVEALPDQLKILNEVEENINIVTPKYSSVTNNIHKNNIEPSEYVPRIKIKEPKYNKNKKNIEKNSDDEENEQTTYLDF